MHATCGPADHLCTLFKMPTTTIPALHLADFRAARAAALMREVDAMVLSHTNPLLSAGSGFGLGDGLSGGLSGLLRQSNAPFLSHLWGLSGRSGAASTSLSKRGRSDDDTPSATRQTAKSQPKPCDDLALQLKSDCPGLESDSGDSMLLNSSDLFDCVSLLSTPDLIGIAAEHSPCGSPPPALELPEAMMWTDVLGEGTGTSEQQSSTCFRPLPPACPSPTPTNAESLASTAPCSPALSIGRMG